MNSWYCRDAVLMAALAAIQLPLSALPAPVTRLLLQHSTPTPKLATPTAVRQHICAPGNASVARAAVAGDVKRAVALLTYCMADIDDSDAGSVRPNLQYLLACLLMSFGCCAYRRLQVC